MPYSVNRKVRIDAASRKQNNEGKRRLAEFGQAVDLHYSTISRIVNPYHGNPVMHRTRLDPQFHSLAVMKSIMTPKSLLHKPIDT